jgi:hypothetical protein
MIGRGRAAAAPVLPPDISNSMAVPEKRPNYEQSTLKVPCRIAAY